jgi:hypothetical protein
LKAFTILLLLVIAVGAQASHRSAVQVTQPIGGTANDVLLCQVLYVGYYDARKPFAAVSLTASANHIPTDLGITNLNLASTMGITVEVPGVNNPNATAYPSSDTLGVLVHVPELVPDQDPTLRELVVHATRQCVLENAKRYWPRIRFVRLAVEGDESFSGLGGLFPLADVIEHVSPRSGWGRIK